ncbi:MAG: thioesterase family protein [Candidatus Alcyoniella australis]|nr:thioesterase family protein [Candidatus Alcyoniella australis]
MNKLVEFKTRVLFGDTDALGIVYYGNYLRFFEIGRAEWYRTLDLPGTHYFDNDRYLVVIEANVRYLRPAVYDQVLRIRTILTELSGARLRLDYQIVDDPSGELIATGYTRHTTTDRTGRVRRFAKDFIQRMSALLSDGF